MQQTDVKRRRLHEDSDAMSEGVRRSSPDLSASPDSMSDQAVAEALLDLSHASLGSPRSSRASGKTSFLAQRPPASYTSAMTSSRCRGQPQAKAQMLLEDDESTTSDEESPKSDAKSRKQGGDAARKRIPSRCKCGKRVSAEHPPCKSELMLLCERFQERFCKLTKDGEPSKIDLNDVTEALGCGRRRLYDITIAYEAAEVLQRNGKLSYLWKGTDHLPDLVQTLRREEDNNEPVGQRGDAPAHNRHGNHSMWTLSRKLMRLLLTTEGPVSLSEAANHLIGDSVKGSKRQQTQMTVERRLYDIGSILSTLDLINRIYADGRRQPSFSWKYGVATGEAPVAPGLGKALETSKADLVAPSAFTKCQDSESLPEVMAGLKRKYSDDSNSNLSTVTNLGLGQSMSLTGPWTTERPSSRLTGAAPSAPQLEIDSLVATPSVSLGWCNSLLAQGCSLAMPIPLTACHMPSLSDFWGFSAPRFEGATLCRPQPTRAPKPVQIANFPSLMSSSLPNLGMSGSFQRTGRQA